MCAENCMITQLDQPHTEEANCLKQVLNLGLADRTQVYYHRRQATPILRPTLWWYRPMLV